MRRVPCKRLLSAREAMTAAGAIQKSIRTVQGRRTSRVYGRRANRAEIRSMRSSQVAPTGLRHSIRSRMLV